MRFASLFSGVGGFDLGLERAGMRVIWQSEIDPYARRVLRRHWPDVPNLGDVTRIDWSTVERPDVICGGYPCQPFSYAGARNGEHDRRHLWPHMLAAIRHLRPRFALLENVRGHLSLGFGRVLGDLAEIGYDAEWDCIPAAAVGAPHARDRVFVVAYPNGQGEPDEPSAVADAEGEPVGTRLRQGSPPRLRWGRPGDGGCARDAWRTEPDVGRVAYGVPARMDRIRGLGNAVVPAVAEHVGRIILDAARTSDVGVDAAPRDTHHTSAHRCADGDEPLRTSRTAVSPAEPSGNHQEAHETDARDRLAIEDEPDAACRAAVVVDGDEHGVTSGQVGSLRLKGEVGVSDELSDVGDAVGHVCIRPQTARQVNHKLGGAA